jgi:hypothetical protein
MLSRNLCGLRAQSNPPTKRKPQPEKKLRAPSIFLRLRCAEIKVHLLVCQEKKEMGWRILSIRRISTFPLYRATGQWVHLP